MLTRRFPLFGGEIEIRIYDVEKDDFVTEDMLEDIYDEALRLQKIFNLYDPESELSGLNIRRVAVVSDEMLYVIKSSLKYSDLTGGRYDVSRGRNFLLRKRGKDTVKLECSYKDIRVRGNMVQLLHDDVIIDLGSIAKGYIVDRIVYFMQSIGIENGFIDARGDMRIFGSFSEIVEVQHPREDRGIWPILFGNSSIATSGDYNQYVTEFKNNHVVGSRDIISATVIGGELAECDALATCLMLMDSKEAIEYCKNNNISALLIDSDMREHPINLPDKYDIKGNDGADHHIDSRYPEAKNE